ncbi:MAG: ABC transporter permease [Candidatus Scatomorpha sp.]|jgi:ABC-type uncharacterized transport system permease subunit
MKNNSRQRLGNEGLLNAGASVICVIIGLIVGFLALCVLSFITLSKTGEAGFANVIALAFDSGMKQILKGGFYLPPMGVGREIVTATALIMCGLSVSFAFKTGLFNIGAAGQYSLGAFGALFCAIVLKLPWPVCLIASVVFGALWGLIPGVLKAYLNINEVISSIMFNWIGLYGINTIIYGAGHGPMFDAGTTKSYALRAVNPSALIPSLGLNVVFKNRSSTIAIFIAILMAFVIHILMNKTVFGFELKGVGSNRDAARYAGINEKKSIMLSMMIAGALAGLGGGLYYLSGAAEWSPLDSSALPAVGFDGIAVALLASSSPIGNIFSAFLISHIKTGGSFMNANVFPPEIATFISGIIIYLCAFVLLFKSALIKLFVKTTQEEEAEQMGESPQTSVSEESAKEA